MTTTSTDRIDIFNSSRKCPSCDGYLCSACKQKTVERDTCVLCAELHRKYNKQTTNTKQVACPACAIEDDEVTGFTCTMCRKLCCFKTHEGFQCHCCRGYCCSECMRSFPVHCSSCKLTVCSAVARNNGSEQASHEDVKEFVKVVRQTSVPSRRPCSRPLPKQFYCRKKKRYIDSRAPVVTDSIPTLKWIYSHGSHLNCLHFKLAYRNECRLCFEQTEKLMNLTRDPQDQTTNRGVSSDILVTCLL